MGDHGANVRRVQSEEQPATWCSDASGPEVDSSGMHFLRLSSHVASHGSRLSIVFTVVHVTILSYIGLSIAEI